MTNEELKQQIDELKAQVKLLEAGSTLPKPVEDAIRDRLRIDTFTPLQTSNKSATSENQSVDEAGTDSYSVLKPPDGWEQRNVGGTTHYYPFWT